MHLDQKEEEGDVIDADKYRRVLSSPPKQSKNQSFVVRELQQLMMHLQFPFAHTLNI